MEKSERERRKHTGECTKRTFPQKALAWKMAWCEFQEFLQPAWLTAWSFKVSWLGSDRALGNCLTPGKKADKKCRGRHQLGNIILKNVWGNGWGEIIHYSRITSLRHSLHREIARGTEELAVAIPLQMPSA